MNDTVRTRIRQTTVVVVGLLVVLSVSGPVGTIAAQEVTTLEQSDDEVTAAPGETVTLTTTVAVEDLNGPGLEVMLPADWSGNMTDADNGFPNTEDGGNVLQVVWLEAGTYEVTYEIDVPADATDGDYVVDVEGSGINPANDERVVDSTQTTITVEEPTANEPPTAAFTATPDAPEAGQQVTFDAAASSDADGTLSSYEWDFDGDGTTDATGEQVTNTFDAAGDHDVTLTVADDAGATNTTSQVLTVVDAPPENQAPSAAFSVDPASPAVGADVTFDASNSEDPDGELADYEWVVDGETLSGETATHAFDAAGDYDVTLTVTDDDGATDSVTQTVTVSEAAPDPSEPSTAMSLSPAAAELMAGDTHDFDVVVEDADGGVGAYNVTVSVDDPSVATIGAATIADDPQSSTVEFADDNSSVTFTAEQLNTDDTGEVTIGTVTTEAEASGTTGLSLAVTALGDEAGISYDIGDVSGATLTVTDDDDDDSSDDDSSDEDGTDDGTDDQDGEKDKDHGSDGDDGTDSDEDCPPGTSDEKDDSKTDEKDGSKTDGDDEPTNEPSDENSTADGTETDDGSADDNSSAADSDDSQAPEGNDTDESQADAPGFGIVLALFALIATGAFAIRRGRTN